MQSFVSNDFTIKDLAKLKTKQGLSNFLEQLRIFSPIDTRLIV